MSDWGEQPRQAPSRRGRPEQPWSAPTDDQSAPRGEQWEEQSPPSRHGGNSPQARYHQPSYGESGYETAYLDPSSARPAYQDDDGYSWRPPGGATPQRVDVEYGDVASRRGRPSPSAEESSYRVDGSPAQYHQDGYVRPGYSDPQQGDGRAASTSAREYAAPSRPASRGGWIEDPGEQVSRTDSYRTGQHAQDPHAAPYDTGYDGARPQDDPGAGYPRRPDPGYGSRTGPAAPERGTYASGQPRGAYESTDYAPTDHVHPAYAPGVYESGAYEPDLYAPSSYEPSAHEPTGYDSTAYAPADPRAATYRAGAPAYAEDVHARDVSRAAHPGRYADEAYHDSTADRYAVGDRTDEYDRPESRRAGFGSRHRSAEPYAEPPAPTRHETPEQRPALPPADRDRAYGNVRFADPEPPPEQYPDQYDDPSHYRSPSSPRSYQAPSRPAAPPPTTADPTGIWGVGGTRAWVAPPTDEENGREQPARRDASNAGASNAGASNAGASRAGAGKDRSRPSTSRPSTTGSPGALARGSETRAAPRASRSGASGLTVGGRLQTKVVILITLVLAAGASLLTIDSARALSSASGESDNRELTAIAETFISGLNAGGPLDAQALSVRIQDLKTANKLNTVEVYSVDQDSGDVKIIADSSGENVNSSLRPELPEAQSILSGVPDYTVKPCEITPASDFELKRGDTCGFAVASTPNPNPTQGVAISRSLEEVHADLARRQRRAAIGVALLSALVAGALAWLLRSMIFSPLRQLQLTIGSLLAGRTERRVDWPRQDEIGSLAGDIDAMADRMQQTRDSLSERALEDELTGLPNRRAGMKQLAVEVAAGQREGSSVAVVVFDVNQLRDINDQYGPEAGDETLRKLADAARLTLRPADVCARLGEDKFLLILRGADARAAHSAMDRLREIMSRIRVGPSGGATISFGVVESWADTDPEDLLRRAEDELARHKDSGARRVRMS